MAKVLYAELDQRAGADGTRLNRLEPTDRREAVREIVSQHLTPIDRSDRIGAEIADQRLYEAVREDAYIGHARGGHRVWADVNDARTDAYILGTDEYDQVHVFVPSHHTTGTARYREVSTPLGQLAEKWTSRRGELQSERELDAARAAEGNDGRRASRSTNASGDAAATRSRAPGSVTEREQSTGIEEHAGSAADALRARSRAHHKRAATPAKAPGTGRGNLISRVRRRRDTPDNSGEPETAHKAPRTSTRLPAEETPRPPTRYADASQVRSATQQEQPASRQRETAIGAARGEPARAGSRTVTIGGEVPMPTTAPSPATGSSAARAEHTRNQANETATR